MPLITNECKIVDQNEKESKLKDIKGKGNSAKKSTSFNTNQVADNNQVTLLEKESGKESNKKIVEERASQSIDSLREHILVENVTNEESSDEKKFEKVTDENAKEVASKQILKVPDSSSEIVFETVINKEAKKIESACVSPTYTSSQKHITVKDEGVTEETASKPESFAYKPIKCNIRNVEDSAIHQNQILEVDINEKEDNIDPLDTIVDAKVSHEFDNNLVAQKSKIVSLEMESSHIAEANTDEEKTANAIIEACKGAIVVEKSVDGETHKESNLQETSTKKKAIRKDSTCIRKTADKTEVPVMENLSKTPTDYFTVANAKVYSESNPCAQVEDSNIIIDTTGNIKEEKTKSNATSIIEPSAGAVIVDKVCGSEIPATADTHKIPERKIATKKKSESIRRTAVENKTTTVENTAETENEAIPAVATQFEEVKPNLSVLVEDNKQTIKTNIGKKIEKSQLPSAESLQDISQIPDLDLDTSETVSLLNEDFISKLKIATKVIVSNFRKGVMVSDVTKYLGEEQVNLLKKPESQIALMNIAERIGNAATIHQTIVDEMSINNENTETFGSRALLIALESSKCNITSEDAVSFFQPKDFDCSKIKSSLCHIINEAHAIESHEPQESYAKPITKDSSVMKAIKSLVQEINEGKTVSEIISERQPKDIENMQCIESQMAMLSVVEKLGYSNVTQNIVLEQMSSDRIGMLNVVGTKALTSILKENSYTTEEVIQLFNMEDFEYENIKEKVAFVLNMAQEINQAQVEEENNMRDSNN